MKVAKRKALLMPSGKTDGPPARGPPGVADELVAPELAEQEGLRADRLQLGVLVQGEVALGAGERDALLAHLRHIAVTI